ncbi:MAG TPA: rod shape-determining protein MreC [Bacteroidetes bacterium]|nr:rod shape-determining protein MreC [Bacteroidota bacterium]
MHNLFLFIQRFYVFFFFLLLTSFSLFILISNNLYQRSAFINTSNAVTGELYTLVSEVRNYFHLKTENEALLLENAELKSRMRDAYYVDTVTSISVNDSIYKQRYQYIDAQVINNSVDKKYNYITLNRGRIHGVQKNDGVICDQGVVGVVVKVSDRFCTVMSLLNRKTNIPPKVDTLMYFGSVKWDGNSFSYAQLTDINRFAPVKVGQMVYTSGYSEHYPENIKIGQIESVNLKDGSNFYDIEIKLSTDFTSLHSVFIVQNLFKAEVHALEEETRKEDDRND